MPPLKPRLGNPKTFNRKIMNLSGVQRRLDRLTREEEGKARARLAAHRKTGNHSVFAYRDRHTRIIALSGEASMSVQFGHHDARGRWVQGIYVLPTSPDHRRGRGAE